MQYFGLYLEVSTGPKLPARHAKFYFDPLRSAINVLYNLYCIICFELLQENQYNYIKLHYHFPLVQILYCPSTTVMYKVECTVVQVATLVGGGNIGKNFIHEFHSSPVLIWRRQTFGSGGTFSKNVLIKDFWKIMKSLQKICTKI